MCKYRIKEMLDEPTGSFRFYIQRKVLWFWVYVDCTMDMQEAQRRIDLYKIREGKRTFKITEIK